MSPFYYKKCYKSIFYIKNMFYVPFDEREYSMFCLDKGSIKLSEEFYKKHLTYGTTGVSFTVASLQDAERGTQSDRVTRT